MSDRVTYEMYADDMRDHERGLDLTRVPGSRPEKTVYIVSSTEIFKPGDIVTVVDSFFWQGRNGIVSTHAEDIYQVAVYMERMDNETELIFIHPKRLKKVG